MNDLKEILDIEIDAVEDTLEEDLKSKYADGLFTEDKKGEKHINENVFAMFYVELNHLFYNNGLFYTKNGKISEDMIKREIWQSVAEIGITQSVANVVNRIFEVVRLVATKDKVRINHEIIPFNNGDLYYKKGVFRLNDYTESPYRLPISLMPTLDKAPHFEKWLNDLFYEEDIPTIQQYLGYCLVPTTRSQKALFLVGEGGTGKSLLGLILQTMLDDALLSTPSTQDFTKDKFKIAELENKLVLYDDDMSKVALENSGLYKKIITNTLNITVDRKYGQPFKLNAHAKLVACCNEMVVASDDDTDGFYRRLLPVLTKPKAPDFIPDRFFYDKVRAEINYITYWALKGLSDLIANNWVLPESERTVNYITQLFADANFMHTFMTDTFTFSDEDAVGMPTTDIHSALRVWCADNGYTAPSTKELSTWLRDNQQKYGIKYCRSVKTPNGYVRGYKGLILGSEKRTKIQLASV